MICISSRHDGEVARRDRRAQVAAVEVRVLGGHRLRLGVGEVLDALLGLEVVLDPEALAAGVDPQEGVAAVAVHVAPGLGRAAVAHQEGDLVRRLRRERPEVPLRVVAPQPVGVHALLRVDKVLELGRVAHEEDRRVVADQVVVALLGVELQGEAARIAHRVGETLLAGNGREAREDGRPLADRAEEGGFGPRGDVGGHLEIAEGAAALGMDNALGHALAVELSHLLDQVVVLQQQGAVHADR